MSRKAYIIEADRVTNAVEGLINAAWRHRRPTAPQEPLPLICVSGVAINLAVLPNVLRGACSHTDLALFVFFAASHHIVHANAIQLQAADLTFTDTCGDQRQHKGIVSK